MRLPVLSAQDHYQRNKEIKRNQLLPFTIHGEGICNKHSHLSPKINLQLQQQSLHRPSSVINVKSAVKANISIEATSSSAQRPLSKK